ncbi:62466dc7-c077-468d-ae7d-29e61eabbd18 [Sclerotinia trifoliorum]|uniref:62466dc7-c077-468d-ae7d-29e61eabbd18 n=1 Tax=Sclerotinia trifoliorum TaxID=28548 RepID=A0A8H2ZM82_9HELO|nr:62466dc7-c077-468d-ae7d-29e61eabbd18 [Sclerotinia trifoliorum]
MFERARKLFFYKTLTEIEDGFLDDNEPFLHSISTEKTRRYPRNSALPWMISTFALALCLLATLLISYPLKLPASYETGFATEMQAGVHIIETEEVHFWGGIKAHPNGTFYMHFDPSTHVRYVGKPTAEMDEAWNRLTGRFVTLTKEESESINGEISEYKPGGYLAATASQHNLHCLNYIRQCLYDDHYPDVHIAREGIPDYWLHIDHCIDTLRQMLQCAGDMTPVPKAYTESRLLLANTEMTHTCRKFENLLEWTQYRYKQTL